MPSQPLKDSVIKLNLHRDKGDYKAKYGSKDAVVFNLVAADVEKPEYNDKHGKSRPVEIPSLDETVDLFLENAEPYSAGKAKYFDGVVNEFVPSLAYGKVK